MNRELVKRHNARISHKDEVWILGDFSFYDNPSQWMSQLNGRKHLILGNHDDDKAIKRSTEGLVESVQHYKELRYQKEFIVLCHYPFAQWNRGHKGSFHLHGHCHGKYKAPKGKILDVGVDTHNYEPYSFEEVAEIMAKLSPHAHHDMGEDDGEGN